MHAPFTTTAANLQGPRRADIAESDDAYPNLPLNDRWRVIECRDGIQWILMARNRTETVARDVWRGRSYCRTREALIRCCDAYCGPIDPAAAAALSALPQHIGGVAGAPDVPVTIPKVARVPAKVLESVARANSRQAGSGMRAAFLGALKRRVTRNPHGKITLPTGKVQAGELAQVLGAIERARR